MTTRVTAALKPFSPQNNRRNYEINDQAGGVHQCGDKRFFTAEPSLGM